MWRRLLTVFALSGVFLSRAAVAQPIVVLIGGNHSDPSPAQLEGKTGRGGNSGLWRMKGDLAADDKLETVYFNWNGTAAGKIDQSPPPGAVGIADFIRRRWTEHPQGPIIIVGNSWGGHTAWQVCRLLNGEAVAKEAGTQTSIDSSTQRNVISNKDWSQPQEVESATQAHNETQTPGGPVQTRQDETAKATSVTSQPEAAAVVPVALVVFLDGSSFGRTKDPNPTVLPGNVHAGINYFTRNTFSWSRWPNEPRIKNVDLGDRANGYMDSSGPRYDSVFNWPAHVSAEWDERIHAAIRQQIRAAIQEPPGLRQ